VREKWDDSSGTRSNYRPGDFAEDLDDETTFNLRPHFSQKTREMGHPQRLEGLCGSEMWATRDERPNLEQKVIGNPAFSI
jgi:hypothetical protein